MMVPAELPCRGRQDHCVVSNKDSQDACPAAPRGGGKKIGQQVCLFALPKKKKVLYCSHKRSVEKST